MCDAPVRLVVLRHGRSVSNMLRDPARLGRPATSREIAASERVLDPALTPFGVSAAEWYLRPLRDVLAALSMPTRHLVVGSSPLLRARETARLLFPGRALTVFQSLGEHGNSPENTPAGGVYRAPDWDAFLEDLADLCRYSRARDVVVVAHGGFMRRVVAAFSGTSPAMANLSGFVMDLRPSGGRLVPEALTLMPFPQRQFEEELPPYRARHESRPAQAALL